MRKWFNLFIFFLLLSLFGWWVQSSPAFRVAEFNITGIQSLSRSAIIQQLGDIESKHFLEILINNPVERLRLHPQIKDAQVTIQFPAQLNISVQERTPIALIPYHDHFLSVDEEGKILQLFTSLSSRTSSLPLLTGLQLPLLTVGEKLLMTPNFLAGVRVLTQISAPYRQQIAEVDVSSALQVILRSIDNIVIDVGEGYRLSENMTYFFEILSYVRSHHLVDGKILIGNGVVDGVVAYYVPDQMPVADKQESNYVDDSSDDDDELVDEEEVAENDWSLTD